MIESTLVRASNIARRVFLGRFSPSLYRKRNRSYWEDTNRKYQGKRGFVICNGPSLRISDLDKLKEEITLASNKIYLAFNETSWRPTFFTVTDPLVAKKISSQVQRYFRVVHAPADIGAHFENCTVLYWRALSAPKRYPDLKVLFSDNASHGFHGGYSITYQNIQFATHLGLNPIYLLGCDHSYKGESDPKRIGTVKASEVNNHFIKGYREKGEIVNAAAINRMTIAFHHARQFAENHGASILNATRGGKLEVFDRVDFDQLVGPVAEHTME